MSCYCDLIFIDDSCRNIPKYHLWKTHSQLRLANLVLNEPCPYDIRTPKTQHKDYTFMNCTRWMIQNIYEMAFIQIDLTNC